jgi:hypothetical protein
MSELTGEAPSPKWFDKVDVKGLGEDDRRVVLERVKGKPGFTKALEALRDLEEGPSQLPLSL